MTQEVVFEKVLAILEPFVTSAGGLAGVTMETSILKDLKVNSARLVDVVLEMEEVFGIQIADDQADNVRTVGDAVQLILSSKA